MDNNQKPVKAKKEKYAKLQIIGVKQAIIYWVIALLCIVAIILYFVARNKNLEKMQNDSQASSSACVTYQLYI